MERRLENVKNLIEIATGQYVEDENLLSYLYDNEVRHIFNDCNLKELPEELRYVAEERTAGAYLQTHVNQLTANGGSGVAKSIREGDVEVTFTDDSPSARLVAISAHWLRDRGGILACYRRIKW